MRSKPCESGRWRDGSGTGSGCVGFSGAALVLLWGSSRWMGACSVISGVLVSPAGIYWLRIGSINSLPFVGSGSGSGSGGWLVVGGWLMRRYAPPICIADMHCRYGATICKA